MRTMVMLCAGAAWLLSLGTPAVAQREIDANTRLEIEAVKQYLRERPQPASTTASPALEKGDAGATSPMKSAAHADRKLYFMNGNKVSTNVYNYGGIGPGYDALRGVNNLVWRGLDYGFQFCPFVAASVPDASNPSRRFHIVSDGLWDYPAYREVSPDGTTLWSWQPLPGYADPDQEFMASNPAPDANKDGKPDSWPRSWYNPTLGRYVWPGYLSQDVLAADQEVYWAMDDRENREFDQLSTAGQYFPFISDTTRSGLGIQIDGRAFQWSNALAENTIFFVYTITNVSDKDLDSVVFGIYGDADLGGGSPENTDDWGDFIPPYDSTGQIDEVPVYSRSMVFFWDP
ncbi:MAG: hypothetical protein H6Q28_1321, partial [Bacteroidetes bacterium]|nr:hypothetical protein [Bacteroidota bacterium]